MKQRNYKWRHYKKRALQPHLKNAAIDPKNTTIGYSRVFHSRVSKHSLSYATIAPCGTQSSVFKNAATNHPIAAFSTLYSRVFTHPQIWDLQLRFVENAAIDSVWVAFCRKCDYRSNLYCVLNATQTEPVAAFSKKRS